MKLFRVILAGIAVISFVCLAVFGLLITAERLEHTSHHTSSGSCPFMPGEMQVCLMSLQDHVAAWQSLLQVKGLTKVFLFVTLGLGWWFANRMISTRHSLSPLVELPQFWLLRIFVTTLQPRAP